jgi:hypothetical protein
LGSVAPIRQGLQRFRQCRNSFNYPAKVKRRIRQSGVRAGLVPAIHAAKLAHNFRLCGLGVDARHKAGHDDNEVR